MRTASRVAATCLMLLAMSFSAWPQSSDQTAPNPDSPAAPTLPPAAAAASTADKPNYYLELGGSYSELDNNNPAWKEFSIRFGYTGDSKRFTPFVTVSSQDRGTGSEQDYGAYSYVTLSKRVWAIVGISGAPERHVILYPTVRVGGSLFVRVLPRVEGLFLSGGYSDIRISGGSGGNIVSVGAIHYGKVILSGNVNFNHDRQSGFNSQWAQAGFQYGHQGRYWFGGGVSGGDAAYQLLGTVPFNVHFNSVGANVFYQRWLTRRFGLILRYDYLSETSLFRKNGVYIGPFFEF